MRDDDQPQDEDRDTVAPEPEFADPADAGGDSPGPDLGVPDAPMASDRRGTTAKEQREPSLDDRLAIERPDVWETGEASDRQPPVRPIVDDDVPADEMNVDAPGFDPAEADMDRTRQEASEQASDFEDEGPEGSAMHVEPE
jgi:hypothetical protein